MKNLLFITLTILIALTGCSKDTALTPNSDLIVVRGYLYADEPVNDIQITATLPLGSAETSAPPINNATITLIKNNNRYELIPSAGDSGYYHYEGDNLNVEAGDKFQIEVVYNNETATAATLVPDAPVGIKLSKSKLSLPDFENMRELMQQGLSMDSIRTMTQLTVSWEQESDALYYIVVENIEDNPKEVETGGMGFGLRGGPLRFISQPIATGEYQVNTMMMTHYGKHRVKVYRVNQEYADLYQTRNQDSRDLNEPLTNIVNGLGVFSAFNSASVTFDFVE